MRRFKTAIYGFLGLSLFLYSWAVFCSERMSTSNVSPELLGASSILWLVAHREQSYNACRPKDMLNVDFAFSR